MAGTNTRDCTVKGIIKLHIVRSTRVNLPIKQPFLVLVTFSSVSSTACDFFFFFFFSLYRNALIFPSSSSHLLGMSTIQQTRSPQNIYRHGTMPRVLEPHPTLYARGRNGSAPLRPTLYAPPLYVRWIPVPCEFQPHQTQGGPTLPSMNELLSTIPEGQVLPSQYPQQSE